MKLELEKSTLRPWQEGDQASLMRHADNRKIWLNLYDRFPHPYTQADAESWVQHAGQHPESKFAIAIDGQAVGAIGLELGNDVHQKTADIGYWLGESFWGQGIISEAVAALTTYAFESLGLIRLQAGVFEWNPASCRILEKAGYSLEARLRKAIFKEGRLLDELLYAKLAPSACPSEGKS